MAESKPVTVGKFAAMKRQGRKITMLTAYDYPTARILDESGVDGILVGDSLAMVVQGHSTTIPVTLDDICYHGKAVAAGLQNAMLMLDMPFGSLNSPQQAIDNASHLLKQTQA